MSVAQAMALSIAKDPAGLSYPPTLPVEIALRTGTIKDICEGYNLDRNDWDRLRQDPMFIEHLGRIVQSLKKEGMSFKLKAQLQSDELLKTSWKMIHSPLDEVPASVKADLLKSTIRWAGLEPEKTKDSGSTIVPLSITLNLA